MAYCENCGAPQFSQYAICFLPLSFYFRSSRPLPHTGQVVLSLEKRRPQEGQIFLLSFPARFCAAPAFAAAPASAAVLLFSAPSQTGHRPVCSSRGLPHRPQNLRRGRDVYKRQGRKGRISFPGLSCHKYIHAKASTYGARTTKR